MSGLVSHRLNVRDRPGLLYRLMRVFAGGQMSLEGDLSKCSFPEDMVVARDEIGLLKRSTLFPRQDFIVLRLDAASLLPIFKAVLAAGVSAAIIHVHIEYGGALQLSIYDNFHPDCVVAGPGVSEVLLAELKSKHVLRSFSVAADSG